MSSRRIHGWSPFEFELTFGVQTVCCVCLWACSGSTLTSNSNPCTIQIKLQECFSVSALNSWENRLETFEFGGGGVVTVRLPVCRKHALNIFQARSKQIRCILLVETPLFLRSDPGILSIGQLQQNSVRNHFELSTCSDWEMSFRFASARPNFLWRCHSKKKSGWNSSFVLKKPN